AIWSQRGSLGRRMPGWNARRPRRIYSAARDGVADVADPGMARDAGHAAHVDADRRQDATGAGAVPEPLVACAPLCERAWAHHFADALGRADAGGGVRFPAGNPRAALERGADRGDRPGVAPGGGVLPRVHGGAGLAR